MVDQVIRNKMKENISETIEKIHDLKPFAVILTVTSAIGPGIAIKAGLKKAYPAEKQPYFLFIDPRLHAQMEKGNAVFRGIKQHVEKIDRFIKSHSEHPEKERIVVYDEFGSHDSVAVIKGYLLTFLK